MSVASELRDYVKTHFVSRDIFLAAANINDGFFEQLIGHQIIPGAIYRIWRNGAIWSPIGGHVGKATLGEPESEWFSPAALWWARRAWVLASSDQLTMPQLAARLQAQFIADFTAAVQSSDVAQHGYPDLFENDTLFVDRCAGVAASEWGDWINGGYGVCLRRFDGRHLIAKTGEAGRIKFLTDNGTKQHLSPDERLDLLDALEKLDAVMLPFAPHQRPFGTPGKWIDAIMDRYGLGHIPLVQSALPEAKIEADNRLCA